MTGQEQIQTQDASGSCNLPLFLGPLAGLNAMHLLLTPLVPPVERSTGKTNKQRNSPECGRDVARLRVVKLARGVIAPEICHFFEGSSEAASPLRGGPDGVKMIALLRRSIFSICASLFSFLSSSSWLPVFFFFLQPASVSVTTCTHFSATVWIIQSEYGV